MTVNENIADCCVTARKKPESYDETGIKKNLLLLKLQPLTSPPSPLCQDSLVCHSFNWDRAVEFSLVPFSRHKRSREESGGDLSPAAAQARQRTLSGYDVWLCLWQELDGKDDPPPDVVDNVEGLQARSCRTSSRGWMNPARRIDESGQGPKRAVDEAVAHLLKIQPGIHNTENSSSKRVARIIQL
jgi:hypothetical protein